jgi:hypothetical protein
MNDHASYFIELTFSTLYSLFLSCVCFLWLASFLSKIINMGAWLPAAFLSMQPWSWWVMMQPASVSRQKVSVLTSHSLIAWITIWTYHLDSHLRRHGFVHLLASWLPARCMLLHFPCHCQHLFSLSHITKFLSWLLRLLVRVFGKYRVTIINSTFRCFSCCMQSRHFLWFLFPTCARSLHQFPKWLFFYVHSRMKKSTFESNACL